MYWASSPSARPFWIRGDQQILLALGVADGTGIGLLGAGDLDAEGLAFGQQGEQLLIQLGDVLSDLVERCHGGSLSSNRGGGAKKASAGEARFVFGFCLREWRRRAFPHEGRINEKAKKNGVCMMCPECNAITIKGFGAMQVKLARGR
jgi:hypothetical protein